MRYLIGFLFLVLIGCGDAEAQNLGPLLVHQTVPMDNVMFLPTDNPMRGRPQTTVTASGARGEYEPISIGLRAVGSDVNNIVLVPTALTNGRNTIPAANIDIKVVKVWYQAQTTATWNGGAKLGAGDFTQNLYPELLLNNDAFIRVNTGAGTNEILQDIAGVPTYVIINAAAEYTPPWTQPTEAAFNIYDAATLQPFSVANGTNKQIWVTIKVPNDIPGGLYTGTIAVSSDGGSHGNITIQFRVHTFDLLTAAQAGFTHSLYYPQVLRPADAGVGSGYKTVAQMRVELANIARHGVTGTTIYGNPTIAAESAYIETAVQLHAEAGLNAGPLYYLGYWTDHTQLELDTYLPSIRALATTYRFTGGFWEYGKDEDTCAGTIPAQVPKWQALQALGDTIFVAAGTDISACALADLNVVNNAGHPSQAMSATWHGANKKIWVYGNSQSGPENPFRMRRNYGLISWANNTDGNFTWAYQYCYGSCYNDRDNGQSPFFRDQMFVYPTVGGVIDTLAWEGYREAADDRRYLATLEAAIAAAPVSGHRARIAEDAQHYLNDLKNAYKDEVPYPNVNDLYIIHDRVVDYINRLTSYPGGPAPGRQSR